ncbi:glycine cleavage system protein GcvH [Apibacter muscae]|uniref:Glycine cleavage system H protein n=1 Tax=Apibacter muscae TaxID=2509004 RepID=A0A563DC28_9FLAO|nr:glycine cleavage system protein GcvH [Apibacter muscae]TWP27324.1 glycine cleavage system protein GcvH [Apibacter muscae]
MNNLKDLWFTDQHQWIRIDDNIAYIGITDYAQKQLGDIVYVDIDTVGKVLNPGDVYGTVEAVKTVSDLFMPIEGKILEINNEIENSPELVNSDSYGKGWIIKVELTKLSSTEGLLNAEEYKSLVA